MKERTMYSKIYSVYFLFWCVVLGAVSYSESGYTQMAVVDVNAIAALKQQLSAWQNQLTLMQNQATQLNTLSEAQLNNRGYGNVLRSSTSALNYLPERWTSATDSSLSSNAPINAQAQKNSVLAPNIASRLPDVINSLTQQINTQHAQNQIYAQQAFAQSADRVAHLNLLLDQVATTHDPQSTAELNARLQGELLLLLNELTRLLSLSQNTRADQDVLSQQAKEQTVNLHGDAQTRFHPKVPAP